MIHHRGVASTLGAPALGSIIILLIYSTTYLPTFLVLDDYTAVSQAARDSSWNAIWALALGRPLNALFINYLFGLFDDVSQVKFIRLIGILGIAATLVTLYRLFRFKLADFDSFLLALAICLLPPFTEVALWASISSYSWSCAIAVCSAILFLKYLHTSRAREAIFSSIVLIAALFSYQPAAQIFFVAPLFFLLFGEHRSSVWLRTIIKSAATFAVAGTIYITAWKSYQAIWLARISLGDRILITSPEQLAAKAKWFISDVLPLAGNLYNLDPIPRAGIFILAFAMLPAVSLRQGWKASLLRLCLLFILFAFSYAANLLVQENWPAYRTQFALQTMILVCVFASARKLIKPVYVRAILLITCLTVGLAHLIFLGPQLTRPHIREWTIAQEAISQIPPETKRIVFIRPPAFINRDSLVRFDTIGTPSSYVTWVPPNMAQIAHIKVFGTPLRLPVVQVAPAERESLNFREGDFVWDMAARIEEKIEMNSRLSKPRL